MDRLQKTFSKGIPDRVPVFPNIETWVMHYAKVSLKEAFTKDPDILYSAFKKVADEIYLDGFFRISNIIQLNMMEQEKKLSETLEDMKKGYFKNVPEVEADVMMRRMVNRLLSR